MPGLEVHAALQNRKLKGGDINAYWVQCNNNMQAAANLNEEGYPGYRNPENFIVVSDPYPTVTVAAEEIATLRGGTPITGESQAPMIGVTHYMDRDGNFLAEVSPRRYFCNQCHVNHTAIRDVFENDFQDMDELLKERAARDQDD